MTRQCYGSGDIFCNSINRELQEIWTVRWYDSREMSKRRQSFGDYFNIHPSIRPPLSLLPLPYYYFFTPSHIRTLFSYPTTIYVYVLTNYHYLTLSNILCVHLWDIIHIHKEIHTYTEKIPIYILIFISHLVVFPFLSMISTKQE